MAKKKIINLDNLEPETEATILKSVNHRLLKDKAEGLFKSAFEAREKYDWEWLTRDLFRRGYQFNTYGKNSKTVSISSSGGVKFPVNLTWTQMRSVINQVTGFKPKWEILPSGKSQEAKDNARLSGALLDYYYYKFNLRKTIKETVMQGLMYSVGGPWQIAFDPEADGGKGEVCIWLIDTFDFYIDPLATSMDTAEYCIKAVRKNLNDITSNKHYKFTTIPEKGEEKIAASPSKQFLIQTMNQVGSKSNEEEEEGAILKEAWIKVYVSEDNKEELTKELKENDQDTKDLQVGEVLMRVVHYVDFIQDPLLVQLLRRDDFPFVEYHADINPCEFYGESWIKHIIPINKVLNALETSVFMYNYKYAIGRIVLDKNSGVRIVSNQHGDFIEKNPGSTVSSLPLQPLPSSYQYQIANCMKYIEDLGGSHEISRGILPPGVTSGIGIAELKQADSTNQADLVQSLEDFLVDVGKKVLSEVAHNYTVPKIAKDLGLSKDIDFFAYIGEDAAKNRKNKREVRIGADSLNLAVIGAENEVRVTIGSWLAYTKTAKQERIKELFNSGLIDQKTALQHMEFSDIDNIIEETRKKELLDRMAGTQAKGTREEVSDEEIARQENVMMAEEGKDVLPLPTDHHTVHLLVHQEALGLDENLLIEKHMEEHRQLMEADGPHGQEPTAEDMVDERMLEGLPPEGLPQGMPPEGMPPEMGQPMGQPQPPQQGSPEEMALLQSMAEAGGQI